MTEPDTPPPAATAPIPVTVLTGFLGSGKTTLLNALLRDPGMDRTAVVVNEFGAIPLDHDLIASAPDTAAGATVLMGSGCLCCAVRGDLAATLSGLARSRAAGSVRFERVVIETSGLADPGPILHTLVLDPELGEDFVLDGVLATVDSAAGAATLDAQPEAVQQVAMADRLILTKADLAAPEARAALEARLARLNPGAPRLAAAHGRIAPAALFGIAPRPDTAPAAALAWAGTGGAPALPALSGLVPAPGHRARPAVPQARHDPRVTTLSAVLDRPVPALAFDLWLESLMATASDRLLRLKAVVHVEGLAHPFALHVVQHIVHPPTLLTDWPHDDTRSSIVVIGRDLGPDWLEASLAPLRGR